ncbi:hypothetical protein VNO77_20040 [Canavalia gladiata]|uniref:Uncharacterized protein n=1 Tax=Canavalia gladiata TaxID=3824 RepID=A0AAN9QL18_CANGL
MKVKRRVGVVLECGGVHEKGHGSAMEMARRNRVRQISESDVGMFDMIFKPTLPIVYMKFPIDLEIWNPGHIVQIVGTCFFSIIKIRYMRL